MRSNELEAWRLFLEINERAGSLWTRTTRFREDIRATLEREFEQELAAYIVNPHFWIDAIVSNRLGLKPRYE